jgi:hypothetical protein
VSDVFAITGSYSATPASGTPSADPIITAALDERLMLATEQYSQLTLNNDSPVALPFGGLTQANVLIVKIVGAAKANVRITSNPGSNQVIPVDSFLALMTASEPITAVSVQRTPGVQTTVRYFLGQKA